jgi:hypothetical protein
MLLHPFDFSLMHWYVFELQLYILHMQPFDFHQTNLVYNALFRPREGGIWDAPGFRFDKKLMPISL